MATPEQSGELSRSDFDRDPLSPDTVDEQLAQLVTLLESALRSEKRERVIHYLEALLVRLVPERSPFYVGRENLRSTHALSEAELTQLTDEDIADIGDRLEAHFRQDWYAEEIVFHAQAVL